MLEKRIMLALNGAEDAFLEETACRLGYNNKRIPAAENYSKRTSCRLAAILIAACLLLSLGIAAYASNLFGIRALLIKDDSSEHSRGENSGHLSITQPQDVPEEMSADVKAKIENSSEAWAAWDSWRKANGLYLPDNCIPPENVSSADYVENEDSSWTITYYEGPVDGGRRVIEARTVTAEEYVAEQEYWNARAKGFAGYDFKYHVYSQDMADKLEEIAASYGLELRREKTCMYQNLVGSTELSSYEEINEKLNELCKGSFFREAPTAFEKFYFFNEGTFAVSFYTTDNFTNSGTRCYLYNSPYGTLSSGFEIIAEVEDAGAMSSYVHTTKDGKEVTVLRNGADMYAYIYLENSFVTMSFHQPKGLSPEEINSIIDMVNFSAID